MNIYVRRKSSYFLDDSGQFFLELPTCKAYSLFAANVVCMSAIVVSFADIVVLSPPLFAENVVSKPPCLQFHLPMFAVRYT
ncbi:MAG: hypothetical protein N4J56_004112 [Chroococcidiopsis sp. SAG 2025]|nr:hypothetical protein [Chroococcidiopsis sp. SAG 2025]